MNEKTTAIGAVVLILVLALGIYFYNRSDADIDDADGSTLNVQTGNNTDDLLNATSSPYNTDGFEPTAS